MGFCSFLLLQNFVLLDFVLLNFVLLDFVMLDFVRWDVFLYHPALRDSTRIPYNALFPNAHSRSKDRYFRPATKDKMSGTLHNSEQR